MAHVLAQILLTTEFFVFFFFKEQNNLLNFLGIIEVLADNVKKLFQKVGNITALALKISKIVKESSVFWYTIALNVVP